MALIPDADDPSDAARSICAGERAGPIKARLMLDARRLKRVNVTNAKAKELADIAKAAISDTARPAAGSGFGPRLKYLAHLAWAYPSRRDLATAAAAATSVPLSISVRLQHQ